MKVRASANLIAPLSLKIYLYSPMSWTEAPHKMNERVHGEEEGEEATDNTYREREESRLEDFIVFRRLCFIRLV